MKAPMPQSTKIGPHAFSVLRKTKSEMPLIDGEKPNGYFDRDALEIGVLKGAKRSSAQEIALHEHLHGIWPEGFGFEEELITRLTPKLLLLMQDNPELIAYLTT